MVRGFGLAAALALAASLAPAQALAQTPAAELPPPAEIELGREIVRLGYPEEARLATFGGVVDTIVGQMNAANEAQLADIDADTRDFILTRQAEMIDELKHVIERHIPALMDGVALAYADVFSADELAEIRDFVATPAGQAFVQRSAGLVSNPYYAAATQPYLEEVMGRVGTWQDSLIAELQERDHHAGRE